MLINARFTDELIKLKRASEESIRAKTGFLANLSHELRGPLGSILNVVELIMDGLCGDVTAQQKEVLGMVKQSGEHLLDLVNDVLDYAKVEAGKITAKPISIPVSPLLEDLVSVIRSQAIAKGHSLTLTPVDETITLVSDKRHVRQMLINLLTNAVKYTPNEGVITVSAQRWPGNNIRIAVADTGIGIATDQQDKVFAAFERVEDSYALSQNGTGLGMPLTRRLAEVNGGKVEFESEIGKGSIFYLILPAGEQIGSLPNSNSATSEESLPAQGMGEVILLVDNDHATREMLGQYLTHHGFRVLHAAKGADVIKLIREETIDLAVVENDMPDLPGEDGVALIRSSPRSVDIPVILLSARAFVFDVERFLKLGVDRCLAKPVPLKELAQTVRRLLDDTRRSPNKGANEFTATP